jgi:hypothetical protein
MGMDLTNAAQLVGKTLGSSTNALSRYGIVIDATAPKQEKLEQLTAALSGKFGGLSEEMANTASGGLTQLSNAFGDLQEALGEQLLSNMDGIVGRLTDFITTATKATQASNALQLALSGEDTGLDPAARFENQKIAVQELRRQLEAVQDAEGAGAAARRVRLQDQLEREEMMLERLEQRRNVMRDLEQAAKRGAAAQEEEAAAQDAVTQRYLDSRALVLDTLNSESDALAEIRTQITQLQATPWASGKLEQDRLEALEALRAKEQEILIQEGKLIDAQAILGTARQTTAEIFAEEQEKILADDRELQENAKNTAQQIASAYSSNILPVFEQLGKAMVQQGEAWKALGAIAIEAVAGILRALAQQAMAKAAVALGDALLGNPAAWAAVAQYGAAAAAASAAAGIVSGLADNVRSAATGAAFVTNGPQMMLVGDNPSGREHVQVTPNDSGDSGGMSGDVYLDGDKVGKWLKRRMDRRQQLVPRSAVV